MKIYAPTARAARRVECPRSNGAPDSAPADFDATANPIIARHFFGVEPFGAIGQVAAEVVADLRRQRAAEHLYSLGPRPVLEALVEVEAGAELDRVLADFARLDPETVRQLAGDQFPPAPIYGVDL